MSYRDAEEGKCCTKWVLVWWTSAAMAEPILPFVEPSLWFQIIWTGIWYVLLVFSWTFVWKRFGCMSSFVADWWHFASYVASHRTTHRIVKNPDWKGQNVSTEDLKIPCFTWPDVTFKGEKDQPSSHRLKPIGLVWYRRARENPRPFYLFGSHVKDGFILDWHLQWLVS